MGNLVEERNRALAQSRKAMMEADFDPGHRPDQVPLRDARLADAAEYAAYQLGQINRKLDKLIAALQSKT
jgi:hypothetical protein